jgi:hypothetical protein
MSRFNYKKCVVSIQDPRRWVSCNFVGTDALIYSQIFKHLSKTNGYFALVLRINPFHGPYTATTWDQQHGKVMHEECVVPNWLGTNVSYYHKGLEKPGQTILQIFNADQTNYCLYHSVQSVFEWRPPRPDDFACFDSNYNLIAYANRHEEEFNILSNSELARSVNLR